MLVAAIGRNMCSETRIAKACKGVQNLLIMRTVYVCECFASFLTTGGDDMQRAHWSWLQIDLLCLGVEGFHD